MLSARRSRRSRGRRSWRRWRRRRRRRRTCHSPSCLSPRWARRRLSTRLVTRLIARPRPLLVPWTATCVHFDPRSNARAPSHGARPQLTGAYQTRSRCSLPPPRLSPPRRAMTPPRRCGRSRVLAAANNAATCTWRSRGRSPFIRTRTSRRQTCSVCGRSTRRQSGVASSRARAMRPTRAARARCSTLFLDLIESIILRRLCRGYTRHRTQHTQQSQRPYRDRHRSQQKLLNTAVSRGPSTDLKHRRSV